MYEVSASPVGTAERRPRGGRGRRPSWLGSRDIESSPALRVGVSVLGIALVQTGYVVGFNGSLADPLCFVLLALMVPGSLRIPVGPTIFFLAVCGISVMTAAFVTPVVFDVQPGLSPTLRALVKYLITFSFFVLGYNLARSNGLLRLFRVYSWSVLVVGSVGVLLAATGAGVFRDLLFLDGGERYRGLVSDPNLWAILVVTALPYFMRTGALSLRGRALAMSLAVPAVLVTGSKTGTVALLGYVAYLMIRATITSRGSQRNVALAMGAVAVILMALPLLPSFEGTSGFITRYIPVADRITTLFVDPEAAVNEGGSGREAALSGALAIIEANPFLGVGAGPYLEVATLLTGRYALAHNTYLQLAADWGVPLTALLFAGVVFLLLSRPASATRSSLIGLQREVLVILLIGSLSISLNNVRFFWLLLGSLTYAVARPRDDGGHGAEQLRDRDPVLVRDGHSAVAGNPGSRGSGA